MTENETIKKHIEECEERIGRILDYMESSEDANTKFCERNVEILKSVVIALEKQVPKKVKKQENNILIAEGWEYGCPSCGCGTGTNKRYQEFTQEDDYCPTCGQKLDWKGCE